MGNGLVERLHRQLKSSIMARSSRTDWMDHLPMVMLGIRSTGRTELDCSPAELVYGTALKVPGFMIGDTGESQELPSTEFIQDLFVKMRDLTPVEMAHHATAKVNVPAAIESADYVYIRTDAVRAPLVWPYTGPFKVLQKSAKYFVVQKNGKPDSVSIDRLKPAAVYEDTVDKEREKSRIPTEKITQPSITKSPETDNVTETTHEVVSTKYRDALLRDRGRHPQDQTDHTSSRTSATRSGRISRPPDRF